MRDDTRALARQMPKTGVAACRTGRAAARRFSRLRPFLIFTYYVKMTFFYEEELLPVSFT